MDGSVRAGTTGSFFSSVVLLLVTVFVLQQSADMYADAGVPLNVSPALMPLFLGCSLLICAVILLRRTLRGQKIADLFAAIGNEIKRWFESDQSDWKRVLGGIFLLGAYSFFLIPIFEFWLSTSIFMISIFLFLRAASLWEIGVITAGTVGGIILLFQQIFKVNLP